MLKILFVSIFYILYSIFSPPLVSAQTKAWDDPQFTGAGMRCVYDTDVATIEGLECMISNLLGVAISLIGIGVFAMLLFGAFQYLTSQGNPEAAEAGKQTITYAVIGLVIAISAWFILNFASLFTGLPQILQFNTQVEDVPGLFP